MKSNFETELENLINRYSKENDSNTPDFILARYLNTCLKNFNAAIFDREQWYGRGKKLSDVEYIEPLDLNYKIPFEFDSEGIQVKNPRSNFSKEFNDELIGQNNEDKTKQSNVFIGYENGTSNGNGSNFIGRPAGHQNFSPELNQAIDELEARGNMLSYSIEKLKKKYRLGEYKNK